jgi:hypothetical protein
MKYDLRTLLPLLAACLLAATPAPKHPVVPKVTLSKVPLHSEFTVEVNAKGQVVRVVSAKGTGSKDTLFNEHTLGNAEQMWIRHPDGSAEVGLYRITYDYNPKDHKIARRVTLIKPGGTWGNDEGAVDRMMSDAQKAEKEQEQRQSKNLPPLHAIIGPSAKPTAHP